MIPQIGGLHDHNLPFKLTGESSNTGFIVRIYHENGYYEEIIAGNHKPANKDIIDKDKNLSLWSMMIFNFVILFLLWGMIYSIAVFSLSNILITPAAVMAFLSLIKLTKNKHLRQWHAVEHKTIEFVERYFDHHQTLNYENFKQCPSISRRCGSMWGYLSIPPFFMFAETLLMVLGLEYFADHIVFQQRILIVWMAMMLVGNINIFATAFLALSYKKPNNILLFLSLPALLMQKYCCLMDPAREKLLTGYLSALDIIGRINNLGNKTPLF